MNKGNIIQFEKPDLASLTQYHTVVDMHYHTRHSDGHNTVEEIAIRARELGIGVAITDHNAIDGAVEMENYQGLLTIPGIEITSMEGAHILVYFYDIEQLKTFYHQDIEPHKGKNVMCSVSLSIETIIKLAKTYETLIIFPHPYSAAYMGICNDCFEQHQLNHLFGMVDGIEVLNSENLNKWNLKSAALGINLAKGITGGSDGHKIDHMGNVVSYASCPKDRKAFLDAIKSGQNKVIGKEMGNVCRIVSNIVKLRKNIHNSPNTLKKSMKYSRIVLHKKTERIKQQINYRLSDISKKGPIAWLTFNSRISLINNIVLVFILAMLV